MRHLVPDLQNLDFDLTKFVSVQDFLWYSVVLLNSGKNFVAVAVRDKQCCQQNGNSQKYVGFLVWFRGNWKKKPFRVGNPDKDNDYDSLEPNVNLFIDS